MEYPGFIDLQVNGYEGIDFLTPETTVDDILLAAGQLREKGTAGFLLTITTNSPEATEINIRHACEAIKRQGHDGPILGIHLEGPFISPEYGYRGAHMLEHVRPPDLDWFQRLQDIADGAIRMVTLAPETEGCIDFIGSISADVLVSMGHANPDAATLRQAIDAGLSSVTHFGNGCRPDIHRHDNILVRTLACPELNLCMISDGQHLPEPFLRMLLCRVPTEQLVVTSDVVMYGGLPSGVYERENTRIRLREDGRLCLADDERLLYGSCLTMMECINHLASLGVLTVAELIQVGFSNPLKLLGLNPDAFSARPPRVRYDEQRRAFSAIH